MSQKWWGSRCKCTILHTWMSHATGRAAARGFSPAAAARHSKFRNSVSRTPYALFFRVQYCETPDVLVVCRALASAQKTSQKTGNTQFSEKSADQRTQRTQNASIHRFFKNQCFGGVLQYFLRACTRSANSGEIGRLELWGPETAVSVLLCFGLAITTRQSHCQF